MLDVQSDCLDHAACLHCGYSLRGLPTHTCPECGRAFDPNDRLTYSTPRESWGCHFRRCTEHLAGPPTWISLVVSVAAAMAIIIPLYDLPAPHVYRNSSDPRLILLFACPALAVSLAYWGFRLARLAVWGVRSRSSRRHVWRWFVAPVAVVLAWTACETSWPLVLRSRVSLPFINAQVKQMVAAGETVSYSRPVGLFRPDYLTVEPGGRTRLVLRESRPGQQGHCEIRRSPGPPRAAPESCLVFSLGADWYLLLWR